MIFLSTLLLSVFVTIALIPLCCRVAVRAHALDMPDGRKVHPAPVPRCGGVAMALGAIAPIVFWAQMSPQLAAYLAGGAILFLAGLFDDFKGLGYQAKFMAQVAAALVLGLAAYALSVRLAWWVTGTDPSAGHDSYSLLGGYPALGDLPRLAWRGLRTASRAPDAFGAFLALGLTAMIGVQAFVNMSVVLGLLPTKGITLPFVSAGGSSLIVSLAGMGVLLNISQRASATR